MANLENTRFFSLRSWIHETEGCKENLFKGKNVFAIQGDTKYIQGVCLLIWTLQTSEVADNSALHQLMDSKSDFDMWNTRSTCCGSPTNYTGFSDRWLVRIIAFRSC